MTAPQCNNGTCDYANPLNRTTTRKRKAQEIRYARLWAEIELPKLLRKPPQDRAEPPEPRSLTRAQAEPRKNDHSPTHALSRAQVKSTQIGRTARRSALRSAGRINAKRKNDHEKNKNKPYLQPRKESTSTKDKPKKNPHKKQEQPKSKKQTCKQHNRS